MKTSLATLLATIAAAQACPYLGYTAGGDNPHDSDAASPRTDNAVNGSARRTRGLSQDASGRATGDDVTPLNFPTPRDAVNALRQDIVDLIASNYRLAPQLIRLTFHDCVDVCDGCIDLSNKDNGGLLTPVEALRPLVKTYSQYLTRTDIWGLAGLVAAEGMQPNNNFEYRFDYFGRPTCDAAAGYTDVAGPPREMPGLDFTTEQTVAYFKKHFGLTADETVAAIGAHTIGQITVAPSGPITSARWVADPTTLDNAFFESVRDGDFNVAQAPNGVAIWQYIGNSGIYRDGTSRNLQVGDFLVFLNSDLGLAYDFDGFMDAGGVVSCNMPQVNATLGAVDCPVASTSSKLNEYVNDNELWMEDFRNAYEKMANSGFNMTDLTAVGTAATGAPSSSPTSTPTAAPTSSSSPLVGLSTLVALQSIVYLLFV